MTSTSPVPSSARKISCYIMLFDDWSVLPSTLALVDPLVDEIVVVDGAYAWMASLLAADGRDPSRSDSRVYDALAPYATKIRIINRLWTDELEKRIAGYEACTHDLVMRIDADELLSLAPDALVNNDWNAFAVWQMEMPVYLAPGLIRQRAGQIEIERQSFLFDRKRVSAVEHLGYLWLVLSKDEQTRIPPADWSKVCQTALAYNAHLTLLRSPESSVTRMRFYILKAIMDNGRSKWASLVSFRPEEGFSITNKELGETFLWHQQANGYQPMAGQVAVKARTNVDDRIQEDYNSFLDGHRSIAERLQSTGMLCVPGDKRMIELSDSAAFPSLAGEGLMTLSFSRAVMVTRANLWRLMAQGASVERELEVVHKGETTQIRFDVSDLDLGDVRRVLVMNLDCPSSDLFTVKIARYG